MVNVSPSFGLSKSGDEVIVQCEEGGYTAVPAHKSWEFLMKKYPNNQALKTAFRLGMAYQKHQSPGCL